LTEVRARLIDEAMFCSSDRVSKAVRDDGDGLILGDVALAAIPSP